MTDTPTPAAADVREPVECPELLSERDTDIYTAAFTRGFDEGEAAAIAQSPASADVIEGMREALIALYDEHHGLNCGIENDAPSWGRGAYAGWDAAIKRVLAMLPALPDSPTTHKGGK